MQDSKVTYFSPALFCIYFLIKVEFNRNYISEIINYSKIFNYYYNIN